MSQYGGSIPHPNKDDGEFYMDVNHFLKYFEQCTICNLTPDVDRDGTADTLSKSLLHTLPKPLRSFPVCWWALCCSVLCVL